MSNKAIGADGAEHFATDFGDSYAGDYFCPDPACRVGLKLKNIGSDAKAYGSRQPYFSASKSAPHREGCPYANTSISYEGLKKAGFRAVDFFSGLQAGYDGTANRSRKAESPATHEAKHNAITTLNKLYHYCLQHRDNDALPDGTKIFELFQDERNRQIPARLRHPARLVKLRFLNCNFREFDLENHCWKLWCIFPHTEKTKPPGIYYTLGFREDSASLMRYICKILTPLKQKNEDVFILVGGEWRGNHCYIASKRQIFILQPGSK